MCLENRLKGKAKKEAIAKLPEVFPIWKFLQDNGTTEFHAKEQPLFSELGVYKAGDFPFGGKATLYHHCYKPGFHAFLKRPVRGGWQSCLFIVKFWVKRRWVREIGIFDSVYKKGKGVVLSRIEVKQLPTTQIRRQNNA